MVYFDPNDVINKFDSDICYRESFLLFSVLVAGKGADIIKEKNNALISDILKNKRGSVFSTIKNNFSDNNYTPFIELLKKHKTGKYSLLLKFITYINNNNVNLFNCSIEDLEKIPGIGKKSSRFFMLYTRPDIKDIAVLDVHILKFLNKNGINAPKTTPTGKEYDRLEKEFISLSKKISPVLTIQDLDFKIWYASKENKETFVINNQKLIPTPF